MVQSVLQLQQTMAVIQVLLQYQQTVEPRRTIRKAVVVLAATEILEVYPEVDTLRDLAVVLAVWVAE
jgi:hypothetical protein